MKRFTETDKWRDVWFRKLTPSCKLAYIYILDNANIAGVWDPDFDLANFTMGEPVDWDAVRVGLGDRLQVLPNGKWHLSRFVAFQYGELSPDCRPHAAVLKLMGAHGLRVSKGYPKGIHTLQDKDKDKDQDKDKEKDIAKDKDQLRAEALMSRRPTTPMSASEQRAWKTAAPVVADTDADSWAVLEWWYGLPHDQAPYRKTDFAALLNNWHAEIEKARRNKAERGEYADKF